MLFAAILIGASSVIFKTISFYRQPNDNTETFWSRKRNYMNSKYRSDKSKLRDFDISKVRFVNRNFKRSDFEMHSRVCDTWNQNCNFSPSIYASKHPIPSHYRPISETPFEWHFAGGPIALSYAYWVFRLMHSNKEKTSICHLKTFSNRLFQV